MEKTTRREATNKRQKEDITPKRKEGRDSKRESTMGEEQGTRKKQQERNNKERGNKEYAMRKTRQWKKQQRE